MASLEKLSCTIAVKVGENDKLFGSVTVGDIAANLKTQGIELDKRKINLAEPIRAVGETDVVVKLYPEISAKMTVRVVGGDK